MATGTYAVTTSKTDVNGLWRKVQTPLQVAAQFMVDEWDMLDDLENMEVDWSAREITMPLDLNDDVGIASIPEGGYEARPSSPNVVDATLTWILLNGRFTISKTARWIDEKNRKAMLERQILYQGKKKLQAIARRIGEYFYGFSTAVIAKVSSQSTTTTVLKDMYGVAGLGSTGSTQVSNLFKVGDYIAFLNPSGPALRSPGFCYIATVTPATNTITTNVDPGASANDLIVFANSLENATYTGGSDYNGGLTGLLDIATSTSIHSLSGGTYPKWKAGYADTTGGRLTGARLRKARQGIHNSGGGDMNTLILTPGVDNDVFAQAQAGLRFSDAFAMELDGQWKFKGTKLINASRFAPQGYAFGFDKRSLRKMVLIEKPGQPTWSDAYKLQDMSGFVFPLDYPCALVCTNRGNFAYFSGLTEV